VPRLGLSRLLAPLPVAGWEVVAAAPGGGGEAGQSELGGESAVRAGVVVGCLERVRGDGEVGRPGGTAEADVAAGDIRRDLQ
jgi:hypothetical protein